MSLGYQYVFNTPLLDAAAAGIYPPQQVDEAVEVGESIVAVGKTILLAQDENVEIAESIVRSGLAIVLVISETVQTSDSPAPILESIIPKEENATLEIYESIIVSGLPYKFAPDTEQIKESIYPIKSPASAAGTPTSVYNLPPYAVASRFRAEFYAHASTRSGSNVTEGTGAKVGAGPAVGGITSWTYAPQLNASGAFSMRCASIDEGFKPVLDGTAQEIEIYYENSGIVFKGRIHASDFDDEGNLVITGHDLGWELQTRSLDYTKIVKEGATKQEAYQALQTELSNMGWSMTFETIASALTLSEIRWRHETILEALISLNEITGINWRVSPTERILYLGDFGDDSGLQMGPVESDDPDALREGMLALINFRYHRDESTIINRIVGQANNTSFGTAPSPRHAHNRRDKIGNAEPRRARGITRTQEVTMHGQTKTIIRTHTEVRPSPLGAYGSPFNESGPADPDGPVNDNLDFAAANPNWNIGAGGQVAIAQAFTPDSNLDVAWISVRFVGVISWGGEGSYMSPMMRIYNDSGGVPNEASPVTAWMQPTNYHLRNDDLGLFRTGSRPSDAVAYGLPANEVLYAFPDLQTLSASTKYHAVFSINELFEESPGSGWLVPAGAPNLAAHSWDDLGSLWGADGAEVGTLDGANLRTLGGSWSGASGDMIIEISGIKSSGSDFAYPVEIRHAPVVNETTNNDKDYETDTWGHYVCFMQDRDSIDANGLRSRTIAFPQIRDSRPGVADVWPQSDALVDAMSTLLSRAKDAHEIFEGETTGAFALPYVGQQIWVAARVLHEVSEGNYTALDLDKLMWVLGMQISVDNAGIRHSITTSNIPDNYLDPDYLMARAVRALHHINDFFAEIDVATNPGATYVETEDLA